MLYSSSSDNKVRMWDLTSPNSEGTYDKIGEDDRINVLNLPPVPGRNVKCQIVKPDGIVIPGLIEPHMHIWTSLLNLTWTDMGHAKCPTFDDVVAAGYTVLLLAVVKAILD